MSRNTARARAGLDRSSLYDGITNKIIGELEAGRALGPALGDGGGERAARHAEERRHRPAIFGEQRPDPLGFGCPASAPMRQNWVN